ncbi:gamma-glutamyl-gamma-aminobutyrate hydrolase family protein [Streptomyces rochei]|uniref:Gamma-glutamyl-gamma-aminobutyrate hydrolase family protein n=2 Tax=Streptomyces rochei TaxID=1928 RepID=A0AAX3ZB61_STRRO|nr:MULTISPECIES: gamma-glutamyl-gamma-aminobutyrate hydrolase family protein [Streptomyces]WMC84067.1 gamma-glutamyl-gamma-aminobutyrate hydrolase family protein [Streptomyces rochei]
MTRPVVAVTADATTVNWNIWGDVAVAVLPQPYLDKVTQAGGAPVLLPPLVEAVESVMERVDALLMSGGADIDPALYGARPGEFVFPPHPARDAAELAALAVAERRGIPVLGVCRGLQLISITRGGTLDQHLPEHSPAVPGRYEPRTIRVKPDSLLGGALGPSPTVYCHHHQGIDKLGAGLVATAWSDDGVIEGAEAEDPSAPFLAGLQAHGELGEDTVALFEAFIEAAKAGPRR